LPRTWDKQHSSSTTPATFPARQPVSAAARPFSVSFQWSQLESEDYPTYIANLRAIGCPERTIRDIVAADLHALLTERRKTPRQQGDGLESDEARVLLELFGPGDTEVIRRDLTPVPRGSILGQRVCLPLVLQSGDGADASFDGVQTRVLRDLRAKFQEDLGSTADPTDPVYRQ